MKPTATPEDVGLSSRRLERVREWMEGEVAAGHLPGVLVAVVRRGKLAFSAWTGDMDMEAGKPMRADTVFRIYSMTKPITSVAAMMLYEEGRFQLDDPVCRYLPALADMRVFTGGDAASFDSEPAKRDITVHDLMTHTSGFTYGFIDATPVDAIYQDRGITFNDTEKPLAEMVALLGAAPLRCHPGAEWNYSVSTDVLGHLIEVWSGVPLDRFLADRILGPLGMTDTGFHVPTPAHDRLAACYRVGEDGALVLNDAPAESRLTKPAVMFSGGGGMVSTADDYLRFMDLLRGRGVSGDVRLLGRKTAEYMTRNHLPGDLASMGQPTFSETSFEGIGFGLGFSVVLDPVRARVIGSPGEYAWGGMAGTAFWIDPVEDLGVLMMTQVIPSSAYPLRRQLRALTYQAIID